LIEHPGKPDMMQCKEFIDRIAYAVVDVNVRILKKFKFITPGQKLYKLMIIACTYGIIINSKFYGKLEGRSQVKSKWRIFIWKIYL